MKKIKPNKKIKMKLKKKANEPKGDKSGLAGMRLILGLSLEVSRDSPFAAFSAGATLAGHVILVKNASTIITFIINRE